MIQSNAVQSFTSCPRFLTFEPYQALKQSQVQKVGAVALACLLFFGIQLSCSWTIAAGIALGSSIITLSSEAFLRMRDTKDQNWMNSDIPKSRLMMQVALRLTLLPLVLSLAIAFGVLPLQTIASEIMAGNVKLIFLAALAAPIAEEILFRGFIQEQLEDLTLLVDRYIYPLPETLKKWFSISLQSLLFGYVHIIGGQVIKQSMKIVVLGSVSVLGFTLTLFKKSDDSLLSPIAIHSSQNTGMIVGLLAGRYLKAL